MRVALLQMRSGVDPDENLKTVADAMRQARAGGVDMLFTPEMTGYLDRDRDRARATIVAEAEDRVLAGVRSLAAELGLWVSIGSLAVGDETAGKWRNRAFVIDGAGAVVARYDKLHMFDVDLASGESWRESAAYAAGEGAVVARTPWAAIGLSICYDLRFADLYRALTDTGAEILTVPAAFTVPTGQAHWHILLRARAIEAGAFVIAPAQCGSHEDGRSTYGHSLVIDPWGEVLLDMGGERQGVGFADLDLSRIETVRRRVPVLDHRRATPNVTIL